MRAALDRATERGVHPGETLASVTAEFRRRVIAATIEAEPTLKAAAKTLGVTRECLWKTRRRLGMPIESQEKPIPADWRARLET